MRAPVCVWRSGVHLCEVRTCGGVPGAGTCGAARTGLAGRGRAAVGPPLRGSQHPPCWSSPQRPRHLLSGCLWPWGDVTCVPVIVHS